MTTDPLDYLSVDDLLEIAAGVIGEFVRPRSRSARLGGRSATDDRVRRGRLPAFAGKAAALMHAIARNHALVDGNKRLAWSATRTFCLLNDRNLEFTVDDAEKLVQSIARGELEAREIEPILTAHTTSV